MLKKLWLLFFTFAKIAALVLGGGLAMLPVIEETFVNKKKLLTNEELLDVVALTQTVPGIIAANAAVAIGTKIAGFAGALAALLGAIFPSFVIILLVTALMNRFLKNNIVQALLRGVKPCVIGIVLATGIHWTLGTLVPPTGEQFSIPSGILFLILAAMLFGSRFFGKKKISPIALIAVSGMLGILLFP